MRTASLFCFEEELSIRLSMRSRFFILLALTAGATALFPKPGKPKVLSIMGKVSQESDAVERKAFQDFEARTGVQIRFAQSLQTVDQRIELFLTLLKAHSPEPDLIDMDVIWAATLAPHLVDLTPFFHDQLKDFAPELLRNFTVNGRLIAIPTFVDAGVLYYRSDLLRKYGFRHPPTTWNELERMAERIQEAERRSGHPGLVGVRLAGRPIRIPYL